jgi:hypothetical protein
MYSNNSQFYNNMLEIHVFSLNDYVRYYAKNMYTFHCPIQNLTET